MAAPRQGEREAVSRGECLGAGPAAQESDQVMKNLQKPRKRPPAPGAPLRAKGPIPGPLSTRGDTGQRQTAATPSKTAPEQTRGS